MNWWHKVYHFFIYFAWFSYGAMLKHIRVHTLFCLTLHRFLQKFPANILNIKLVSGITLLFLYCMDCYICNVLQYWVYNYFFVLLFLLCFFFFFFIIKIWLRVQECIWFYKQHRNPLGSGPPRKWLSPREKETWCLSSNPPYNDTQRCVISKESAQQKWIDKSGFRKQDSICLFVWTLNYNELVQLLIYVLYKQKTTIKLFDRQPNINHICTNLMP